MANLGRLSKVYIAKMLLLRTWGSLVNIVKVGGKKPVLHGIFIRQMNF